MEMCDVPESKYGTGMTLAEMLGNDTGEIVEDKDVNEFTHPYLFYAKKKQSVGSSPPDSGIEKAMVRESLEFQTVRRSSEHEERPGTTPASSVFPAVESKKSVSSLV
jgi:hypothetical protein